MTQLIHFNVHDIREVSDETILLPEIKGVASVVEYRFAVDDPPVFGFTYMQTNSWRSEENLRGAPEYQQQVLLQSVILPMQREHARFSRRRASFVLVVLIFLGAVPVGWAIVCRRRMALGKANAT